MAHDAHLPAGRQAPRFALIAGWLALIGGMTVLVGWAWDIAALKSVLPIWVAMKANTALCFVLLGIALLASLKGPEHTTRQFALPGSAVAACTLLAGAVAFVALLEYMLGSNWGIDQWLFEEAPGAIATSHPGRMAPDTALSFVLLAISLWTQRASGRSSVVAATSIGIGLAVVAIAIAAMLSYLTPQLGFFGWFGTTVMAMHTSFLLALLGLAFAGLSWHRNPDAWVLGKNVTLLATIGMLGLVACGLNLNRAQVSQEMINARLLVLEQSHDRADLIRARLVQANGDLRSYVLTDDKHYWESYLASKLAIIAHLGVLRSSLSEHPTDVGKDHLAQVTALFEQQAAWPLMVSDQARANAASRAHTARQLAVELDAALEKLKLVQARHRELLGNMRRESMRSSDITYSTILGATFVSVVLFLMVAIRLNASELKRRRTEQALVRSELQYRSVVQSANDAIVTVDGDGHVVGWNTSAEHIFGYTAGEILGQSVTLLVPERFKARHIAGMNQALAGVEVRVVGTTTEVYGLRKDGSELPIDLSLSRWEDAGNRFFTGTIRDATKRKSAEEEIRKLSQAVEQSPENIIITNLAVEIEYVNEAFIATTGYGRDEVLGRNPRFLQSGHTPPETYRNLWETLANGRTWQGDFHNRRKDGSEYTELATISPIRQTDGRISHYVAVMQDVTERQRASDAILQSKQLLQRVIDSIPDWIYVEGRDHRLMLANQSFAGAFARTPETMVGLDATGLMTGVTVDPADHDRAKHAGADYEVVLGGKSIHVPIERISLGGGESRYFETFKGPLRDTSQNIYGILCYRRDITERVNTELEQKALERQLIQAQKMELIGHLTGGIAHDFNNILASMLGFSELLQMSPELQRSPKLMDHLHEVLQAGIRAKELVAQLLTFSQRRDAPTEAIQVTPIVREVITLLRATLPASIAVTAEFARTLPGALISPLKLHQVLMNLGVNARDAISTQGSINIKVSEISIDNAINCASCHGPFSGRYVLISVADSGAGIAPDILPRIFDPFFTTKGVGQGSGLGLSVLHGIVHSANGHAEVRSTVGTGTEFRIFLPAQTEQHAMPPVASDAAHESKSAQGHVLVVDDEISIVTFMKELLEASGYRVTGVTSPIDALRLFRERPDDINLVITDQSMPGISGVDLAKEVIARRPGLPVVLSTGNIGVVDEEALRKIGIRRLLIKPVPAKMLLETIGEYLQR